MTPKTIPVAMFVALAALCGLSLAVPGAGAAPGIDTTPGIVIHGYVFDRDHQVVANATVTLLRDGAPLPMSSNPAVTDTNGYYAFWGIGRGPYCLVASKAPHSISNTILVQEWDVMQNFTLQASAAELANPAGPTPSPAPAVPITPTPAATAPAGPTPVPAAAPGFRALVLLSGLLAAVLVRGIRAR